MNKKSYFRDIEWEGWIFRIFFLIILGMFLFVLILIIIDSVSVKYDVGSIQTGCYDRYENEMLNQTCLKNISCSQRGIVEEYKCNNLPENIKLFEDT